MSIRLVLVDSSAQSVHRAPGKVNVSIPGRLITEPPKTRPCQENERWANLNFYWTFRWGGHFL